MKTLLTLVMAFSLSQVYAQSVMSSGAATGSPGNVSPAGSGINSNPSINQPTFGSDVPNRGTTTGTVRNNTINNTNTTTDAVGTSQSATTTTRRVIPNTPGTVTPANTNATGVNCVDRSGRNYGSGDSGYTACVNSMRMR